MPVNGKKRQDLHGQWGELILFGGAAGAIAAPIKLLVHHIFVWLHLSQPFYTQLNAYMTHGHYRTEGILESLFAEMGDIAIGALFGLVVSFVLRHSRPRYHWWLGAGLGFGIWYATLVFGNLTRIIKPNQTTPWSMFAHLLAMLTFGLLIVLASRIWPAYRKRVQD